MNIRQATHSDQQEWDDFVCLHPKSVPYQLFGWMLAIENIYKFKNVSLIAEEKGQIIGVFPLILFKLPFTHPSLVALPFCDVGTLLTTNETAEAGLFKVALEIASKYSVSKIDLRGKVSSGILKNCGHTVQIMHNKVRMLLELPDSSDALWTGFKSKLRSQIRKAEKNGLRFELANHKMNEFYSVFSENMRDLGSPVHSQKWIKEVVHQLEGNSYLGLVYNGDRPVGAGIMLKVGDKISIPWASTLRDYNHLNPNMLLYWGFLKYSADNGCGVFDFGRSTPGEGTYKFKAQWGATPVDLPWNHVFLQDEPTVNSVGSSVSRQYIEALWKKLPLGIANYFGPQIRKYISL